MHWASDSSSDFRAHKDGRASDRQSQDSGDFLENPFRTVPSTIAFLGLCAFAVMSFYILGHRYRQARKYKSCRSHPRAVLNLQSARAMAKGIDTDDLWIWYTQSEMATRDWVDSGEGVTNNDEEIPSIGKTPYRYTKSEGGTVGPSGGRDDGAELTTVRHQNSQERQLIPGGAATSDRLPYANQKKPGDELERIRKTLRSRMVMPTAVVVGPVGDSGLAQRRRTASNKSM